jgi:phospholipase/carboxylesterase
MRNEVHRSSTLEYLAVYPDDYSARIPCPLLIWLHGFGASMDDLASLAHAVHPPGYLHVLPNAPLGGFDGPEGTVRAWFERGGKERPDSVRLALAAFDTLMQELVKRFRLRPGKALLVGFSQGANLALRYGLQRPDVFAGVAALSCSLRQGEDLRANLPAERAQAIFMAHGIGDFMVPVSYSRAVVAFLKEQGFSPAYREYQMGHEITEALFADLTGWIARTLPVKGECLGQQ